jgi:hypothetical protein
VGLPGSWIVLFLRAVVVHPAGCDLPSPTSLSRRPPSPSGRTKPWASETNTVFVAAFPRPTRSRTYASPVASPRPSQGSLPVGAALPFSGRVSHPLDDKPNFMSSSHLSLLSDQPFLVALFSLHSSLYARIQQAFPQDTLSHHSGRAEQNDIHVAGCSYQERRV